ncbi:response regulator transcription factor [Dactylosporangium sp. NPDC005572]|uniref:response regulator transcription factor n=1 Tax=Dactylosporangium sp. NPDC005572 TaxID=3156889 RepID=UPI0033A20B5C
MKLLVVEDDDRVMAALRTVLAQHGLEVACARTGEQALELVADGPDAVLLDLGLPDRDGFKVCMQIRKMSSVPIIVVTARADWRSRVHGLNLGADDYVVKPYYVAELVARIHAVTRRAGTTTPVSAETPPPAVIATPRVFGPVSLDPASRMVMVDGRRIHLTVKEFDLFALLARRPGVVFRREQIMSEVWGTAWGGAGRTLEVHVASLRQKLATPGLIETVRGVGYRLTLAVCSTAVA